MQILEGQHYRLNPGPREDPIVQHRQLPAAKLLGRHPLERPFGRRWDINQRRQNRRVLLRIYTDLLQRAFPIPKLNEGECSATAASWPIPPRYEEFRAAG
jgi:hypothetical protein